MGNLLFFVILLNLTLEWISNTPEKDLRWTSTLNFPSLTQSQRQKIIDEFKIKPDAFLMSEKWKPEKTLDRIEKV